MLEGKSGRNSGGAGVRYLHRVGTGEGWWHGNLLYGAGGECRAISVERSGEMVVQGREKTGVKPYEARRSSSPSSRRATGAGIGGRGYCWV